MARYCRFGDSSIVYVFVSVEWDYSIQFYQQNHLCKYVPRGAAELRIFRRGRYR